jgi:hypothetical protein
VPVHRTGSGIVGTELIEVARHRVLRIDEVANLGKSPPHAAAGSVVGVLGHHHPHRAGVPRAGAASASAQRPVLGPIAGMSATTMPIAACTAIHRFRIFFLPRDVSACAFFVSFLRSPLVSQSPPGIDVASCDHSGVACIPLAPTRLSNVARSSRVARAVDPGIGSPSEGTDEVLAAGDKE